MPTSPDQTQVAFDLLLSEIASALEQVKAEMKQATDGDDFARAGNLLKRAQAITAFSERVRKLQTEWRTLAPAREPARDASPRLAKGLRTPEDAYRLPLLRALKQLGGKGTPKQVIPLVYEQMRERLNDLDQKPTRGTRGAPRWQNAVHWCRNALVEDGLLRKDSRHGVWEISEKGEAWLKKQEKAAASPLTPSLFSTLDWQGIEHGLEPLPQPLGDALSVFRLMHSHRLSYNAAARAVAEHRGLTTVNTVYDSCTRRIEVSTDRFRELVQSPTLLLRHLCRRYPQYASALEELVVDDF